MPKLPKEKYSLIYHLNIEEIKIMELCVNFQTEKPKRQWTSEKKKV